MKLTILDVTRYARLWRLSWWTQRLALLPALLATYPILWVPILAGEKQGSVAVNAVNNVLAHALYPLLAMGAASVLLFIVYYLSRGTFRPKLVGLNTFVIALLTITTFVAYVIIALNNKSSSFEGSGDFISFHRDMLVKHMNMLAIICVVSWVLLPAKSFLLSAILRHHLADWLPPTHRMTRSLRANLAMPQLSSWKGYAVHSAVLLALGALGFHAGLLFVMKGTIGGPFSAFWLLLLLIRELLESVSSPEALHLQEFLQRNAELVEYTTNFLIIVGTLVAAGIVWRFGKRLNLRRRDEIILKNKPPVLLLRSFVDDKAVIKSSLLAARLLRRRKRLEETLGKELAKAGPFVAIGQPGEKLPPIGAQRLYLDDSRWEDVVMSYIKRAEPIIVIAGKAHWLQWEFVSVISQGRLDKLLIVFPPVPAADRRARWESLKLAFNGTSWSAATECIDAGDALVVFAGDDGQFAVIRSSTVHESDYVAALRIATYLIKRRTIRSRCRKIGQRTFKGTSSMAEGTLLSTSPRSIGCRRGYN